MKTDRPVSLTFFPQPLAAIVSFSHRITGIALFVGVAFGLYALDMALSSPAGFAAAVELIHQPFPAFILFGLLFALVFHIVAGIKHLLLDFHIGDSLAAAKNSALIVLLVSVVITVALGVSLW